VHPKQLTPLIKQQRSLATLQELLQQNSSLVNAINVNAAMQWLLGHTEEQPQAPEQLAALVKQWMGWVDVDDLTARLCANLAYYCSKLGYVEDLGLYRALLQRFMVVKGEADPQGVSNLLYALGSQEQLRVLLQQDVLVALLQQLQQVADKGKPWDVSNALWAAAKVEPHDSLISEQVLMQLLRSFISSMGCTNAQDVANVLYALALLPRVCSMDSALQLVERLVQLLPQAKPQDMANVVWALGQYAERGWLSDLPAQSLARVMAAATLLLNGLGGGVVQGRPGGSRSVVVCSRDLANACWGVAKLQQLGDVPPGEQPWKEAFSSAVQAFVPLLPKAIPQDVANIMWACAVLHHKPPQLLQALTTAPMPQVQQAGPQHASNLAWALAIVAPVPPPIALMACLLQRMQHLLSQQNAAVGCQDLANTAWAVVVLDLQQLAGQLAPLAAAAFSQQRWAYSQARTVYQWYQVHLWLTDTQALGPGGLGAFPGVSQQQLQKCRAAWEEALATDTKSSRVQQDVAKVRFDQTC
jgi:hypothetical protein